MGQKVEVGGTGYDLKGGKPLIGGTAYAIKKGRTLVGGTGYDISLLSGTPISDLPVGSVVKIAVNGALQEFLIVNQGRPSSIYNTSCDGTWLLMKDIYEKRQWDSSDSSDIRYSTIHSYLNGAFLTLLDVEIKGLIRQAEIPCSYQYSRFNVSAKVFLLSDREVGFSSGDYRYFPDDGAKTSYFIDGTGSDACNKRIAYLNGANTDWWTRSVHPADTSSVWQVSSSGFWNYTNASFSAGIRPAFVLPFDTQVSDDGSILG